MKKYCIISILLEIIPNDIACPQNILLNLKPNKKILLYSP